MSDNMLKMRLVARYLNKVYFAPNCDYSRALFELLLRKTGKTELDPIDLPLLSNMGFNLEFDGDTKALNNDLERYDIMHDFDNGRLSIP
jgi:hypothetical protein